MRRLHPDQLFGAPQTVAGTAHTVAADEDGVPLRFTNGSAVTVTAPSDANAEIPVGACWPLRQAGAGLVSVVADAGVTLLSTNNSLGGQQTSGLLVKTAANTYLLLGGVA